MHRSQWVTLAGEGHARHVVKKSVFVARAAPITSVEHADAMITEEKKQHATAKHHVYAWRICHDQQRQRFSDDQEPSGTAGRPVLDLLIKQRIDDAIIIVSRYFGGVLLGTGGLRRAYTRAAELAVEQADIATCQTGGRWTVESDYEDADRLKTALSNSGYPILAIQYAAQVRLDIFCAPAIDDCLCQLVMEATSGRGTVTKGGSYTYTSKGSKTRGQDR